MSRIIVFTADWCSLCRRVKRELEDAGIPYEEIDVDSDQGFLEARNRGLRSLPTVMATNKHGSEVTFAGIFSLVSLKDFLER